MSASAFSLYVGEFIGLLALLAFVLVGAAVIFSALRPAPLTDAERDVDQLAGRKRGER